MSIAGRILVGAGILAALIVIAPFALLATGTYRLFYIPSEAMRPTFDVGDKIVTRMSAPTPLNRGDIVLVNNGSGSMYIKRVAGLPGDRFAMQGGIILLNGRPVPQHQVGTERVQPDAFGDTVRRLSEQFPGEASPHEIYDAGESVGDDFSEVTVPSGHVFLLGDNRDHSADSRFSHEEQGLGGPVALTDIRGAPLFFYATTGRHRVGDGAGH